MTEGDDCLSFGLTLSNANFLILFGKGDSDSSQKAKPPKALGGLQWSYWPDL